MLGEENGKGNMRSTRNGGRRALAWGLESSGEATAALSCRWRIDFRAKKCEKEFWRNN